MFRKAVIFVVLVGLVALVAGWYCSYVLYAHDGVMSSSLSKAGYSGPQGFLWTTRTQSGHFLGVSSVRGRCAIALFLRGIRPTWLAPFSDDIEKPVAALSGSSYLELRLRYWVSTVVLAALAAIAYFLPVFRRARLRTQGRCVNCGYRLVGILSERCPECGQPTSSPSRSCLRAIGHGDVPFIVEIRAALRDSDSAYAASCLPASAGS
jgi:hypothetical protein